MAETLGELLNATTISSSGLDITIACSDHDTKDAIFDLLETAASPLESFHEEIRGAVLEAAEAIRKDNDVRAAHEILALGAKRAIASEKLK